jgi:hypothetical protein
VNKLYASTERKEKKIKVKSEKKRKNKIYSMYNNLPPRQQRQKLDTIK